MTEQETMSALAETIEDSYQGNIVQDIILDEADRRLIVKSLNAQSRALAQYTQCREVFSDRYVTVRELLTRKTLSEVVSRNSLDDDMKTLHRTEGESDIEFVRRIIATYLAIVGDAPASHSPAAVEPAQDENERGPLIDVVAALAAAVSLLEHTPRAKKAAASDKMFDQMLADYKGALERGRAALHSPAEGEALAPYLDAALRHADGLSAQLSKPDWTPRRAHIEQARNTIRNLVEKIRGQS